ncbi:RAM signaling network component [Rhizina undulata]
MNDPPPPYTSMIFDASPTPPHQPSQSLNVPPPGYRHGPPVPIDKAACISLVTNALKEAREKVNSNIIRNGSASSVESQRPGVTIDLSHQKIANIPLEVIELIKDEIERSERHKLLILVGFTSFTLTAPLKKYSKESWRPLALAHNYLTSFSDEFSSLQRLRYLNLRSNFLKEFPAALTRIPSLEILDISRNRLRSLPQDFGSLISLKVLSMSKNKINILPTYICEMNDLKILKLDHNPIVFPPKEILEGAEPDRDVWLGNVKKFLRQHAERSGSMQDTESGSSSDEAVGENDYSSLNTAFSRTPTLEADPHELHLTTVRPLRVNGADPVSMQPIREGIQKVLGIRKPPAVLSPLMPGSSFSSPSQQSSPTSNSASQAERLRSNSESTAQNRGSRRMGMLGPRKNSNVVLEGLRTVDEHQKPVKHQRGYSHDSIIDSGQRGTQVGKSAEGGGSRSPTDKVRQPGPYFRRLSSLPENKRYSLTSARIGEAARGILYAMATLQRPIEQYIQSTGENSVTQKVERALYNGNIHVGSLVDALEQYEERDDEPAVETVIDACISCVAAFRQVMVMLQSTLKDLGGGIWGPDVRYKRTLLLLVFGSYVETQSSYEILKPLIISKFASMENVHASNTGLLPRQPFGPSRLKSTSTASLITTSSPYSQVPPPLPTPKSADSFVIPPTPGLQSDGGFDHDDPLYGKFQSAINSAMNSLPVIDREIKLALTHNLHPSTILKMREISSLCGIGTEAAKRMSKIKWEAIQDGDLGERKRFWEDTNKFTNYFKLMINIAELIKSVTQEYTFPKATLLAVGTVVRPTKDLFILMNGSSFRHMVEAQSHPSHLYNPGAAIAARGIIHD